ncbi:MAG: hypothetical protein PHT79_09735 [Syntrophomonadaceae bacterium]|nr:hypothetical protein [Syntrophomonadaceae bacterium]MDD4550023.1 hypothetical protein [Syntrophomonadaceae bacterium]
MLISPGHGLLLKIPFIADRTVPPSKRTFLVISTNKNNITMLNVSSVKGKERKLAFPSNVLLNNYNPPFNRPSFVKLDEIYDLEFYADLDKSVLNHGYTLDGEELKRIFGKLTFYQKRHGSSQRLFFDVPSLQRCNSF